MLIAKLLKTRRKKNREVKKHLETRVDAYVDSLTLRVLGTTLNGIDANTVSDGFAAMRRNEASDEVWADLAQEEVGGASAVADDNYPAPTPHQRH